MISEGGNNIEKKHFPEELLEIDIKYNCFAGKWGENDFITLE
jgi:hypothetical protein